MTPAASLAVLHLDETAGLARQAEHARIGVPIRRGALRPGAAACLTDESGAAIPTQTRTLAVWPDGSVKWLLLDVLLSSAPGESRRLRLAESNPPLLQRAVEVSGDEHDTVLENGQLRVRLRKAGELRASLAVPGAAGKPVVDAEAGLRFCSGGRSYPAIVGATQILDEGPLRCTVSQSGQVRTTAGRLPLDFDVRWTLTAGSPVIECDLLLRNPRRARHAGGTWDLGDKGSEHIEEFSLDIRPRAASTGLRWTAERGSEGHGQVADGVVIYQDSSGGENWNSPNHVDAEGELTVAFQGYEIRTGTGTVISQGLRANPSLDVVLGEHELACAMQDFWQNFPKALRYVDGSLQAALFPHESRASVELQGGEQKRHRVWVSFGNAGAAASALQSRQFPLRLRLDPRSVEASGAIYGFEAPGVDDDPRFVAYLHSIVDGEHSFYAGREKIDEFGWRHFGDVYADHEAVKHDSTKLFISHYNNQYDVVLATLLQGLRSGDARWWQLASDLARHVADIDIYHTSEDKAAFNGGMFWHTDHHLPAARATHRTYSRDNAAGRSYGGGPSDEHNYTTGLLQFHYLTGDPDAAAAVRSLADFVMGMDDGNRTLFAPLNQSATGAASSTTTADYHGPGRGAGNSINALLDAFALTGERRYLRKAEELIERCIHPREDIASLRLDEPELRWSYLVFLQVLGKYLAMKEGLGEADYGFHYARDSLLHLAAWMLENERPYREQLHKVLLPTETWPAHDIRKARVLASSARYTADEALSARMLEAAAFYARRCLDDVLSFDSAYLVRPRVLLAAYGPFSPSLSGHSAPSELKRTYPYPYAPKEPFRSQRQRLLPQLLDRTRTALAEIRRMFS